MGGGRWLLSAPIDFMLLVGAVVTWQFEELAPQVGFLALIVGLTATAALFVVRSRTLRPGERRAWRFIGLGVSLFTVGVVVIGVLSTSGVELRAFGIFDLFFIAAYVAIIAGIYRLARLDSGGQEWALTAMDASVGAIALAALVWNAFFSQLVEAFDSVPWWEGLMAVIYPITDIAVVIAVMTLVMRRSNYHLDIRLVFLGAGAAIQVLADFVYMSGSIGEDFAAGEPAWGLNLIAAALLLITATIVDQTPRKREFPEAPTPLWALAWPYALAAVLLAVHFQSYRRIATSGEEILLLDAVILIGVVIFLRQVYVIYRDRNRVDAKRAELVASVSHELRTPLTAMVGFLTLLDQHGDEFPPEAQEEMISEAADQARHMSRLVSDLLMLAKGDPGQLSLEKRDVRGIGLVVSVLRNLEPSDTKVEEDLAAEATVRVDPDRIKQALSNLLNNAVRYGGDRVLVVARLDESDLIFEVHDNGQGVPTRYETAIWEHFERGDHRLDATTPGLGIGLTIVQAVAISHGGTADYRRSERLGGAAFSIVIPDCVVTIAADDEVPVGG